jgi:5-methylcytosine-specific restriction endonuclease McrA
VDPFLKRTRSTYSGHRQRARRDRQTLDYTISDLRVWLLERSIADALWRCACCEGLIVIEDLSLDHRQPISRGGRHELANLAVTCRTCNEVKGMLTAAEWSQLWDVLRRWPPAAIADVLRRLRGGGARRGQIIRRGKLP